MQDNEQLMLKALEAIKVNDHMRAAEILEVVLRNDPQNDDAWLMSAKLFKDPRKRLQYAKKALAVNPNNDDAKWMVSTLPTEIDNAEFRKNARILSAFGLDFFLIFVLIGALIFLLGRFGIFSFGSDQIIAAPPTAVPTVPPIEGLRIGEIKNDNSFQLNTSAQSAPLSNPSITPNGEFVAFKNGLHIFLFDLSGGQRKSILVSKTPDGDPANGTSHSPDISSDGRFVVFISTSTELLLDQETTGQNIYVYDRETDEVELISKLSNGEPLNAPTGEILAPKISGDGLSITYQSLSSEIVEGDIGFRDDVFVFNRLTQETVRVSVSNSGENGNGGSRNPDISADGRFIVFSSTATNFSDEAVSSKAQIFIYDMLLNQLELVASEPERAVTPKISGNGQIVAYKTLAERTDRNDLNVLRVVVVDRESQQKETYFDNLNQSVNIFEPTIKDTHIDLSDNGQFLVIGQSLEEISQLKQEARIPDLYVVDRSAPLISRFEVRDYGVVDGVYSPVVSNSGEEIVFSELSLGKSYRNGMDTYMLQP